ncbi:MAG: SEC-C metal-binding domain-containing protein, partial [Patescibacteria group bacterium]
LKLKGVPHQLLNAKNHEQEAKIIAGAGERGAVTVATNMAGRGVDIVLGGAAPVNNKLINEWQEKHDEVVRLGGLYVLGTEKHESRRIDNQLRGRSGRQGDPGESRFFVSLEDDLMRIFGGEQISKMMTFLNFPEDQPLTHSMVSKAIEQAQVKVEGFNFDIRKHLVDFDDVLNKQRQIVYELRKKNTKETILEMFKEEIAVLVNNYMISIDQQTDEDKTRLIQELNMIIPFDEKELASVIESKNQEKIIEFLNQTIDKQYNVRNKKLGKEIWEDIIRTVILSTIDKFWMDHLTAIEDLREGINLRGYGQMDPLVEYKNEAYSMFEKLIGNINFEVTRRLFKIEINIGTNIEPHVHTHENPKMILQSASAIDPFNQAQQKQPDFAKASSGKAITKPHGKLGRNEPCWCGSGKKYKKCHYPN